MHAHFEDTLADRLAIAEIAILCGIVDTGGAPEADFPLVADLGGRGPPVIFGKVAMTGVGLATAGN